MEVKFKKLSDKAVVPSRAHASDAGLDLTATRITTEVNECGQFVLVYHTDLAFEIPEGYVGFVFPRSSIAKKSVYFTNSVSVIDSNYRGELIFKLKNTSGDSIPSVYNVGDKFAQLIIMPYPSIKLIASEELSESERGSDGFGSSDKKNEDISAETNAPAAESKNDSESV